MAKKKMVGERYDAHVRAWELSLSPEERFLLYDQRSKEALVSEFPSADESSLLCSYEARRNDLSKSANPRKRFNVPDITYWEMRDLLNNRYPLISQA